MTTRIPFTLRQNAEPAAEPVLLATLKEHLRLDIDDEDTTLAVRLATARKDAEAFCGRAFISQTYKMHLEAFPYGCGPEALIELPRSPLISVQAVKYYDEDGTLTTLSSSLYTVESDNEPGRVYPSGLGEWPTTFTERATVVTVEFTAGYGTSPSDVPAPIRSAVFLLAGDLYAYREDTITGTIVSTLPTSAARLLSKYRVPAAMLAVA